MIGTSMASNIEESKNDKDALNRIKQIEQVMQNFEKQMGRQIEESLNEIHKRVDKNDEETELIKSMVESNKKMLVKFEVSFADMREVLLQVTETLQDLEESALSEANKGTP